MRARVCFVWLCVRVCNINQTVTDLIKIIVCEFALKLVFIILHECVINGAAAPPCGEIFTHHLYTHPESSIFPFQFRIALIRIIFFLFITVNYNAN